MLVEDDNNLREIYEARMQAEGFDVVTARDGEEALVVAKAEHPELVVSDVMMPKISGFEMLDILRNTDGLKDVKVIMLTALGQADDQQRADRLGADRYLVKSQVTLEDIVNAAHQLLGDLPEPEAEPLVQSNPAPEPVPVMAPPVVAPVAVVTPTAPPAPAAEQVVLTPVAVPAPETVTAPAPVSEPVSTPAVEPPLAPPADPGPAVPAPQSDVTPPVVQTTFSAVQVEPPASPDPTIVAQMPTAVDTTPVMPIASTTVLTDSSPLTTAQEEANVEAQIEDFVSGATSNAPASYVPNAPASDAALAPVVAPPSDAAIDDKIMEDAVNNLIAGTPPQTDVPNALAEAPSSNPETQPVPTAPPTTSFDIQPSPESVPQSPVIAGKKIISPLASSGTAPDLNALLAKEEAKNIMVEPAVVTSPEPVPQPAVLTAPLPVNSAPVAVTPAPVAAPTPAAPTVADSTKPDPSSIAL